MRKSSAQKSSSEIEEYRKSQMEKAEEEILHEAYIMIQNEIASVKNKHSRKISLSELEGRRKLLMLREELSGKVFEEAAAHVLEFTKSSEYAKYLCDAVKKCCNEIPEGNIVIQVKKDDMQFADMLISASGREAKAEANLNINLGGVIVNHVEKGLVVDETLDLKIGDQKDWFAAQSGLSIGM